MAVTKDNWQEILKSKNIASDRFITQSESTLIELANDLAAAQVAFRETIRKALDRIEDEDPEGLEDHMIIHEALEETEQIAKDCDRDEHPTADDWFCALIASAQRRQAVSELYAMRAEFGSHLFDSLISKSKAI